MNNRFETLKIFCVSAETLQFKETANRLAISPPVVTRAIAELEDFLGEPLFVRNTRQMRLSAFGEAFLPQALSLLQASDLLFVPSRLRQQQEMRGVVRITVPELPDEQGIFNELLEAIKPYPDLRVEWYKGAERLNRVRAKIDLGVRVGVPAVDSNLIVKPLGKVQEKLVASPDFLANQGEIKQLEALHNLPLIGIFDPNTGRAWSWYFNEETQFNGHNHRLLVNQSQEALQACRAGVGVAYLLDWLCSADLQQGKLVELFADIPKQQWSVYLYRPQQTATPPRVKFIFDLLADIIRKRL